MRNRKKKWTENELTTNQLLIDFVNNESLSGNWNRLFGSENPIYLEVGCGKGRFIVENAKNNPNINYIGLEKEAAVIASAIRLARESGELKNLLFISANAADLGVVFAQNELSRLYLNFSDPWDSRKKWAKRRLTHRSFLEIYEKILDPVEIFLKTDNAFLFEFSLTEFEANGFALTQLTRDLHSGEFANDNILTEYEEKFSKKGFKINRLVAIKQS